MHEIWGLFIFLVFSIILSSLMCCGCCKMNKKYEIFSKNNSPEINLAKKIKSKYFYFFSFILIYVMQIIILIPIAVIYQKSYKENCVIFLLFILNMLTGYFYLLKKKIWKGQKVNN